MTGRPKKYMRSRLDEIAARGNHNGIAGMAIFTGRHNIDGDTRRAFRRDQIVRVVVCRDGFRMSVLAGIGTHCLPDVTPFSRTRLAAMMEAAPLEAIKANGLDWQIFGTWVPQDYPGPYTHVEVGMWLPSRPGPEWEEYQSLDGNLATYDMVPVDMVRQLVAAHGGEIAYRARHDHVRRVLTAMNRVDNRAKRRRSRR